MPNVAADAHAPQFRLFASSAGPRLLVIPHSRIFAIDQKFANALGHNDGWAVAQISQLAESLAAEVSLDAIPATTPQSISLNVSSTCNLGCSYCYAGQGEFNGAQTSAMSWAVARAAVDRLLELSDPAVPVTIGFIGGEPFLNRTLIHRVVDYSTQAAGRRGQVARFSVTTNGTMLSDEDLALLRTNPFAVTVSIDGGRQLHDSQRPAKSGRSSFDTLRRTIEPLLRSPGHAKIAARATVTRSTLRIAERFDDITRIGFPEVGFSPVRTGASVSDMLADDDWREYLDEMAALGARELATALSGGPIRLTNLAVALKQLHRGSSMPYPCGAGGGYFSVAVDGTWYACHRAIGHEAYALGDNDGLDADRRDSFLRARHVHAQPQCRICWARYLCSGGCHQEASARSDSSCGFIRGWLDFCLHAYGEMIAHRPQWFDPRTVI